MKDLSKTLLCFYQGAYGPTILINVQTKEWLEYFKKSILLLVEGVTHELQIDCLDNIAIDNLKSLKLVKVRREKYRKIVVSNNCFVWSLDIEELITVIGLIDGLLDSSGSGHQYLTDEGDNVLVKLSYKEWRKT